MTQIPPGGGKKPSNANPANVREPDNTPPPSDPTPDKPPRRESAKTDIQTEGE